ncbi:MAG: peptidoglycan DD-metalloendopeptidase family protein [Ectothiorhodospiraceae bacterium]|nr:peptidoglycan DD-metalloendopeptidase family protein [Ectothiorhodospiraceae bacterium]
MRSFRVLLPALLLSLALPAAADYESRARELERLRSDISELEARLQERRQQADSVGDELARVEQSMGRVNRNLRELERDRAHVLERLEQLRRETAAEEQRVVAHRDYLRQEIRQAYMAGRQELLQLLLSQEDPAALDRMLVYFDYVSRARRERIVQAAGELERLASLRRDVERERTELARLEEEQRAQRAALEQQRAERQTVLARLQRDISGADQQLRQLTEDEARLEAMLEELRDALADLPEGDLIRRPFAEQRGSLRWPAEGEVLARFGSSAGRMDGAWQGVLLGVDEGAPINAVAHGRVVFANWLRGYGLLLIIDHGDGYMTLYGHNDSLYRDVGDWVEAGEVIAAAGTSGGRDHPGLYFELRAEGRPQNPLTWLRRQG